MNRLALLTTAATPSLSAAAFAQTGTAPMNGAGSAMQPGSPGMTAPSYQGQPSQPAGKEDLMDRVSDDNGKPRLQAASPDKPDRDHDRLHAATPDEPLMPIQHQGSAHPDQNQAQAPGGGTDRDRNQPPRNRE